MKKGSPTPASRREGPVRWGRVASALALAVCWAPLVAHASLEYDRQYSLKTVGYLRSWDNVDGLFQEYVTAAFKDYFARQSRFVVHDLTRANDVLAQSKLPYYQVIQDPEVLAQLARSTRTETIVRTKITKEGPQYRFVLDWLHAPKMDVMATFTFTMDEPKAGQPLGVSDIQALIQKGLDEMLSKVPFLATVTGRDNQSVTINVGFNANLKKGDQLVVSTIDDVKRHPLLKSIVGWKLTRVGKIEVDQIDEGLAFCRVLEEEPGRQVSRYQKVTQLIPAATPAEVETVDEKAETQKKLELPPRLGWIAGVLMPGFYDRSFSTSASRFAGSGLIVGARAEGELWITKSWFANMRFGYGFGAYGQEIYTGGVKTGNSPVMGIGSSTFRLNFGYSYLITGDFFGPKGWIKLGYQNTSYSLPISVTDGTGPTVFGSLFVGLGGDLPIRHPFGATLDFAYRIITGVGQTGFTVGDQTSNADVEFMLGGYYRITNRLTARVGFEIHAAGVDYSNGVSISQKTITLSPALLYYF